MELLALPVAVAATCCLCTWVLLRLPRHRPDTGRGSASSVVLVLLAPWVSVLLLVIPWAVAAAVGNAVPAWAGWAFWLSILGSVPAGLVVWFLGVSRSALPAQGRRLLGVFGTGCVVVAVLGSALLLSAWDDGPSVWIAVIGLAVAAVLLLAWRVARALILGTGDLAALTR